MSQVFISYSRRDSDFVKHLVLTLEAVRIDNWLDQDDIEPAADWRERIQAGIESAANFIFVISPTSIQSTECRQELETAQRNGKRLIPIVYKEVDPQLTPPALASLNWIFFREGIDDFQIAFTKLVTAIKTDLAWAHVHSRIQTRALEWKRKDQDASFLLRGKDLQDAEQQLAGAKLDKDPQPTELQRQYVLVGRQEATHRQRRNFMMVSIALVLVVGLAIASSILWGKAETQRAIAERAEATAVAERDLKATAQIQADNARSTAVIDRDLKSTAQVKAENAEAIAIAERDLKATAQLIAETQRDIAISRQLAAQALVLATDQLDLALLLAIEASRGTTDGQLSLSNLLQAESQLIRIVSNTEDFLGQGPGGEIADLALSPDGNQLVAKSYNGAGFWDLNTHEAYGLDPERFQQYYDDWGLYQTSSPDPGNLIQTLDISTLFGPSSAVSNRAAFSACRTQPAAGGAPGCSSLIYIFEKEFGRLITPLESCNPTENMLDFQIELEGGVYYVQNLQSAVNLPAEFMLYSVALENKASNYGSKLAGSLYDSQTNRLVTAAAVGRHDSELFFNLWDLDDRRPILEYFSPLWGTTQAKFNFSKDGAALDVCGADSDIRIDIDPKSWQAQACEIAGRNLSIIEWEWFIADEPYRLTCPQWPAGN